MRRNKHPARMVAMRTKLSFARAAQVSAAMQQDRQCGRKTASLRRGMVVAANPGKRSHVCRSTITRPGLYVRREAVQLRRHITLPLKWSNDHLLQQQLGTSYRSDMQTAAPKIKCKKNQYLSSSPIVALTKRAERIAPSVWMSSPFPSSAKSTTVLAAKNLTWDG